MIGFRDRNYCINKECQNAAGCDRYLNDDVKFAAKVWWGGKDAPIAMADFKNHCDKYKPPEKNDG
jgi:hypothetical protein